MALKPFFSLIFALFLFSCSFEQEEQINYEAEFNSIVSEFEKSSILNFDRKDIEKDTFLEQFITKLDKQKNTFLQEDLNKFREDSNNKIKSNYQQLKEVVDLYYQRYEESLKTRRQYLNNFEFNYNKNEQINLKPRDSFFQNKQEKQDYQRKIVKNELINLLLENKNNFEAKI